MKTEKPDTKAILDGLKDFQRNTVDHVFRRMYTDSDCVKRFLVADEVGLGKTLIARGLIAKAIDHLWNGKRRIDVIYVCSNADIARQNIASLNVLGDNRFALASRLTLLAIKLKDMQKQKINFVSFTPSTSFEVSSTGWTMERELLYHFINNHIEGGNFKKMTRVLVGNAGLEDFRSRVNSFFERYTSAHPKIERNFVDLLEQQPEVLQKFHELCDAMPRSDVQVPKELAAECTTLIGKLRRLLAEAGVKWLEPDLVILDEFQRFKDLLGGSQEEATPAAELANRLFDFREDPNDPSTQARVLLLSATPYKMFTSHQESNKDNHYEDLQSTLRFLMPDRSDFDKTLQCIDHYRSELLKASSDNGLQAIVAKQQLEACMRRVMTRTERLASSLDRSGMLAELNTVIPQLHETDLQHYLSLRKLAEHLESNDVMSFWKSAPYLLNFMSDYDFKHRVITNCEKPKQAKEFVDAFSAAKPSMLKRKEVEAYSPIDPANPTLRGFQDRLRKSNSYDLLWISPSLPYYKASGVYAKPNARDFTKQLIFSSWKVVPRVVASLVSYDAERTIMTRSTFKRKNTADAWSKHTPPMQFRSNKGSPSGMALFTHIYPCQFFAEKFDPASFASTGDLDNLKSSKQVLDEVAASIRATLAQQLSEIASDEATDPSWYWAAPILLDRITHGDGVKDWMCSRDWDRRNVDEVDVSESWQEHIQRVRDYLDEKYKLGAPPKDLYSVLARMAIAGPATCALRAFQRNDQTRTCGEVSQWNAARSVGESFVHLFNLRESTAVIRATDRTGDKADQRRTPYWRLALRYCVSGNLQAMLDEFLHLHNDAPGASTRRVGEDIEGIDACSARADTIHDVITIRTSTIQADMFQVASNRVKKADGLKFRTRFAMAFGDQKSDDDKEGSRKKQVQDSFNSPFWPFVLVSTSVGQEGLDFHRYCHSVIHWNLPSNPVDLEQREGRIHRYKGHALRRNIAESFRKKMDWSKEDLWQELFAVARRAADGARVELYPYWICDEGRAKIERHVPTLPLSKERQHQANLMSSLAVYRLVFGQNRQEDLMNYLINHVPSELVVELTKACSIDLSPLAAKIDSTD